jgi:hypothetical protein
MKSWIRFEHLYRTVNGERVTYMKRLIIGRLRLHFFYRGDGDEDPHDHPFDFWTFPLHDYVEEVLDHEYGDHQIVVVDRFKWHFRHATHTHRVLGRRPLLEGPRKFVTIVWASKKKREWGFWRDDEFIPWRRYVARVRS